MNDKRLPDAIIGRLSECERWSLSWWTGSKSCGRTPQIDRAPGERFKRLLALAASHRLTLDEFAGLRRAELNRLKLTYVHRDGRSTLPPAARQPT